MNIGIIGTGNMGNILIEAFIESDAVPPSNFTITNRTIQKAETIKINYPTINVVSTGEEVVTSSDLIFICVKPLEIYPLLQRLSSCLSINKCIVSITSPVSVEQLESVVDCQVARVIPSITNRALSGVSLFTFGNSCTLQYREYLEDLFKQISTPVQIDNEITRVASDIVSCGPAFFSYLLQKFINGAVNETKISEEQATVLASEMIIGMGKLLEKEIFTLPTLQQKVCVKGGVTGEGIKALEENIGDLFEKMYQNTHSKYDEDIYEVNKQFNETSSR
ncbi:late competence protein ComER [Fredinandcohnia quinoae]|uniref:Late competence protein ComER n=1 Tax=Fredinandcohnia quinoae TaxID=2918902 RepID=A0AAW5DWI7_9BACI|nr:late competence protein ComER [Fredinandcohnia sp. SECRCQ15]MCH1625005.1 late competence protein ComER [Fredinandcohnia sp. SECRCQ15]